MNAFAQYIYTYLYMWHVWIFFVLNVFFNRVLWTAKGRAIAIPVDLDNQVHNLFVKSNNIVQKTAMSWRLSARNAARRDSVVTASRDYRNIIERLQVHGLAPSPESPNAIWASVQQSGYSSPWTFRTLCRPSRTACALWSRPSCRSWWTYCTGLSCSFLKTQTPVRSARVEVSFASKPSRIKPSHFPSLILVRKELKGANPSTFPQADQTHQAAAGGEWREAVHQSFANTARNDDQRPWIWRKGKEKVHK